MHMKVFTFVGMLASIAQLTSAAAMAEPAERASVAGNLERRNIAGIYGCDQPNWKGNCWWQQASGGLCHPWGGAWTSFGPDHGLKCTLYEGNSCNGNQAKKAGIEYPGLATVGTVHDVLLNQDNGPRSFNCGWA